MTNLSLPKGTRDFSGETLKKRNYIIKIIKNIFELYGFEELQTPSLENINTLMGKYGEEGDKLIFRILNNGDTFKEVDLNDNKKNILNNISERALRYDLTIPFARFVTMNYNSLTMPYKRYQIQPVWRGDRPQKGRYREFYQCDADLVGSNSLFHEVEFINIYQKVFQKLNIPKTIIHINSRKILLALINKIDASNYESDILIAIDKIDKIGINGIIDELKLKLNQEQINLLIKFLNFNGNNEEIIFELKKYFDNNQIANKGIFELEYVINNINKLNNYLNIKIDLTLARGLNYYTGLIFEVKTTAIKIGSIGGGGRYDNLTSSMGLENLSGVGISFGLDRIYDVMEELKIFPENLSQSSKFLFFNLGENEFKICFKLANEMREKNISCEIYHEKSKFEKQFKYAEKKGITYIIIIGENEIINKQAKCKNIVSGKEITINLSEITNIIDF